MPARTTPTTAKTSSRTADLVVVGARSGDQLAGDLGVAGVTPRVAEVAGFTGAVGQTLLVPATGDRGPDHLLVGLGAAADVDANRLRAAAGTAGRAVTRHARVVVALGEKAADGTTPEAGGRRRQRGVDAGGLPVRRPPHRRDALRGALGDAHRGRRPGGAATRWPAGPRWPGPSSWPGTWSTSRAGRWSRWRWPTASGRWAARPG